MTVRGIYTSARSSCLLVLFFLLFVVPVDAFELSGHARVEGRFYSNPPLDSIQSEYDASLLLQPELYHKFEDGPALVFVPFVRLDSADPKRTHFDVRELNALWVGDDWEFRLGVGKVFWGTTEFVHLVDVINQTDLVENIDGEDKLGQPMAQLTLIRDWGVVDVFLLPGFRERTFPGKKGRLRTSAYVDTDYPRYESSSRERHVDYALRYSNTIGDWDFGIYHFVGTGREPVPLVGTNNVGDVVYFPYYQQVGQTGLNVQMVDGDWLYKLEALYQTNKTRNYSAFVGGFEYTLPGGVGETGWDLGFLMEYAYDSRLRQSPSLYENDLMFGLRLALNDAESSELLAGLARDMDSSSTAFSIEASRRLSNNFKATLESSFFLKNPSREGFYQLRRDNYLSLDISYYF